MKIGRNDLCPCGSGKKYKKCCLNKEDNKDVDNSGINNNPMNIFAYHNNYLHTKKVKANKINKKLLNILDNHKNMSTKQIIDDYLEAMNYILDYAKKNKLHTLEELDNEELVADFLMNIIADFDNEILNLSEEEYDLSIINAYLDKLINTINLDYHSYESTLRCKTTNLFKLGKYELGEKTMLALIEKSISIYPYVELVDNYQMIGNFDKARYYYDLGMKQTNLEDLDVLEERIDYFK